MCIFGVLQIRLSAFDPFFVIIPHQALLYPACISTTSLVFRIVFFLPAPALFLIIKSQH